MSSEVRIAPASREELTALFVGELSRRRLFALGQFAFAECERCSLCIVHPGTSSSFVVEAEVVYVRNEEPGCGVGLALVGLDATKLGELEAFVRQGGSTRAAAGNGAQGKSLPERIRNLSLREREAVARQGTLSERVALERVFGSSVWESLLQNPQLTVPEVAHIAAKGTLPIPLIAVIANNSGWLASGEVRRALLGNPRATGTTLDRVLQATPRNELRQIAHASPYRPQVRATAKKLVGEP